SSSLLLFSGYRGRGPHSNNLQDTGLVFSSIVMDFLCVVSDEAARRHRFKPCRIVFRTCLHPPCALKNRNVPGIIVVMRAAVMMRQPLLQDDIESRFIGITQYGGDFGSSSRIRDPFDIFRKLNIDRFWIQVRSVNRCNAQKNRDEREKSKHASS